jgi:hypothetical protein
MLLPYLFPLHVNYLFMLYAFYLIMSRLAAVTQFCLGAIHHAREGVLTLVASVPTGAKIRHDHASATRPEVEAL